MNPVKSVSCKCENLGLGLVPCADLFICVQQAESQRGNSQKIIAALEEENVRAYKVRVCACVLLGHGVTWS